MDVPAKLVLAQVGEARRVVDMRVRQKHGLNRVRIELKPVLPISLLPLPLKQTRSPTGFGCLAFRKMAASGDRTRGAMKQIFMRQSLHGLTDQIPCLLGRFCKWKSARSLEPMSPFFCQHGPIDEPFPIGPPDEGRTRNVAGFAGLEKGEGFKQFVERAEPPGKTTSARHEGENAFYVTRSSEIGNTGPVRDVGFGCCSCGRG